MVRLGAFLAALPRAMVPKPPIPSRFVQTRESTQAAISDTYNGDGKVYTALRAAAYVSWEILSFVFTDADW